MGLLQYNILSVGPLDPIEVALPVLGASHAIAPLRILVVDDEPLCREVLANLCDRLGATVEMAGDGKEALELLAMREFDLALLDRTMAGVSGIELLRSIREFHNAVDLPVVMVTSVGDSASVIEAFEAGANDYLTKPVDIGIAKARLGTQMKLKQLQRQLAESEQRYALAIMGTNDGLWDWNLLTSSVYFSPRWQAMLGLPEREHWGSPEHWLSRVHPDDFLQMEEVLEAHLRGETEHFEIELRMAHASGQYRWMLCRGQAVANAKGKLVRMAGAVTDITKGKVVDPLTGLPNRTFLLERLARRVERYARDPTSSFAVMYLDLDNFKQVNDNYGHAAGDQLLVSLARGLEATVRRSDAVISRLGGDEFAILLEEVDVQGTAEVVAKRIADVVATPITLGGRYQTTPSASIGVALPTPDLVTQDDLLRAADIAMYYAKGEGKAGYRVFDPAMQEELHRKLDMEIVLRRGAEQLSKRPEEAPFKLCYEPICDLATGRVVALECHLRWLHPELGPLGPRDFLPLAEEIGVAAAICQWFREEACDQLQQLRTAEPLLHGLCLHMAIGKEEVAHRELINGLEYALSTARLSPSDLVIAIPEEEMMRNSAIGLALLGNLRQLGVRIAIGDFGMGHSSITRLHTLDLDYLVLGEPFTSAVGSCKRQRTLVEAVNTIAQGLGFSVITQGIHQQEQAEVLHQLGCHYAQGAYYSPLLALGEVAKCVTSRN